VAGRSRSKKETTLHRCVRAARVGPRRRTCALRFQRTPRAAPGQEKFARPPRFAVQGEGFRRGRCAFASQARSASVTGSGRAQFPLPPGAPPHRHIPRGEEMEMPCVSNSALS
jgi:hypothetical protein